MNEPPQAGKKNLFPLEGKGKLPLMIMALIDLFDPTMDDVKTDPSTDMSRDQPVGVPNGRFGASISNWPEN